MSHAVSNEENKIYPKDTYLFVSWVDTFDLYSSYSMPWSMYKRISLKNILFSIQ